MPIEHHPSETTADDTAYDATTWNNNLDAATKNVIRDKIETMPTITGAEILTTKKYQLDDDLGTDHTAEGTIINDTVGENVVFGDLLYMKSDGKWWKGSSAVASSAEAPIEAMAVATISADASGNLLLDGTVRDDTWNFTTIGKVYAGVDVPTHTIPSTSGHTVQIIGTSLDADRMLFKPDSTYVELS